MLKQDTHIIKGMVKDISPSKFSKESAYDIRNMRITATDSQTGYSLASEKGTTAVSLVYPSGVSAPSGIPIGQTIIANKLVVFFTTYDGEEQSSGETPDTIGYYSYVTNNNVTSLNYTQLYKGNLNFSSLYPIEAIPLYENDKLQKVYWIDGRNQTRFINVSSSQELISSWNNKSFDFVRELQLKEEITIEKNLNSGGEFKPGVIQYCFTYYNQNGVESNIFYTSPQYYVSPSNRGGNPDETVNTSFTIKLTNLDPNFEYVRIYSILRSSLDAEAQVKRVADLRVQKENSNTTEIDEYILFKQITSDSRLPVIKWYASYENALNDYGGTILNENNPNYTKNQLGQTPFVWEKHWYITNGNKPCFRVQIPNIGEYYYLYFYPKDNNRYVNFVRQNRVVLGTPYTDALYFYCSDIAGDEGGSSTYKSIQDLQDGGNLKDGFYVEAISKSNISYTDNGTTGESVDPTELLYIGGKEVVFKSLSQKDNTLFFGNCSLVNKNIELTEKNKWRLQEGDTIFNNNKTVSFPTAKGFYPYLNPLDYNSENIKTFKYLETYRLGVQFQYKTGEWSEAVWIGDFKNNQAINTGKIGDKTSIGLVQGSYSFNNNNNRITNLVNKGYKKIRPIVVYPTLLDRECLCQGVLNPTVYNVRDRADNSPFAQASWFFRPFAPYSMNSANTTSIINTDPNKPEYSPAGIKQAIYSSQGAALNSVNKGDVAEFRHNRMIPNGYDRNGEIQCFNYSTSALFGNSTDPLVPEGTEVNNWISYRNGLFYVDQSIVTLNSPDLDFDESIQNLDVSKYKLRIVGMIPFTASNTDVSIETSTAVNIYKNLTSTTGDGNSPQGFYKENIGVNTEFTSINNGVPSWRDSYFGWRLALAELYWLDDLEEYTSPNCNPDSFDIGFFIYPWHRNGSLNNNKVANEGYRPAMLKRKVWSTTRLSYDNVFLNSTNIWTPTYGISGAAIFNSNEVSVIKLQSPQNSALPNINYYGNVDKIVTSPRSEYPICAIRGWNDNGTSRTEILKHNIFISSIDTAEHSLAGMTSTVTGVDPVSIKYKSPIHAVIALNYNNMNQQVVLPTIYDTYNGTITKINDVDRSTFGTSKLFFDPKNNNSSLIEISGVSQDTINPTTAPWTMEGYNHTSPNHGWLWLGELYQDDIQNKFGGNSAEAIENNRWVPCGEPISLVDSSNNPLSSVTVKWTEGDTYYQRYDCLKTCPFTENDQNSIVEILSFMCESRVNTAGRYDKNRGNPSNLNARPTNFNLFNPVYSQQNNFFTYRTVNDNRLNLDKFTNTITWTKTKTLGEEVDSWTNITMASTLDLDGDKGEIKAIRRFNDNLITFQDKGISLIKYNENVQISSDSGVPIELVNSNKVTGSMSISDKIGCKNKWSIVQTKNGLYFIDSITGDFYKFDGSKLENISDKSGMHTWFNSNIDYNTWNPKDFNGAITYYDKKNNDILIITKSDCLIYNEYLGQFSGFFSYEKTPYFSSLENKTLLWHTDSNSSYRLWNYMDNDYPQFFGSYKDFGVTIISNEDTLIDKTFTNLEFRADVEPALSSDVLMLPFSHLRVWNEYQDTDIINGTTHTNVAFNTTNLRKKFNVWRALIPRHNGGRDRVRNPWVYVQLINSSNNSPKKTILHDICVDYII